ncbi:hypothetical protein [Phenylobacterium sp. SCN 70-31]|uniref:hypothetical protein n=1 Tax=Phenylobacterium sp. SCN 70-31 TaxID=1660129 RepID=UPI0025F1EDE0|nr:hypothetical protein [Phenylobacterium sp. SCN 70-31]
MAHATLGFWPWRAGASFAARSILVHPGDVHQAAARIATEMRGTQAWALPSLAHESQCLLDLRLMDLKPPTGGGSAKSILVRSPTLLETTSVFAPMAGTGLPYLPDPTQVLRRVRAYTHMRDENAGLTDHVAAIGDPMCAPFGLFGLPAENRADRLGRYFAAKRFSEIGLDGVLVDATRNGRSELSDDWDRRLAVLLDALATVPGRRPPVIVLVEDVFAMRRAAKVLRVHAAAQQPRRRRAIETGAYLPDPSPFAAAIDLGVVHPPVQFDADIKDASLAPLREDLVSLGRTLREAGHQKAAEGVSQALALLRRSASLPIGLEEARAISDILYDADDEVDVSARSLFRPKMALAALAAIKDTVPEFGQVAARLAAAVEAKVAAWSDETPVSAKLASVLQDADWNRRTTLMAVGDRRVMEAYLGSDRAVGYDGAVTDHGGLRQELQDRSYERLIVVSPTPHAIRTLLSVATCPSRVLLLGDAAGSALVVAEAAPIGQIAAFAPMAARAQALGTALARGGANERLDLAEAEFRIAATLPEGEIDFTQAGERYRGDIIQLRTQRGHRLAYRPTSDVLLSSPGELRPFEKVQAREVKKGDRLLVLNAEVREPIRRALAGSREALSQLQLYHDHINRIFAETPGGSVVDKARHMLAAMRAIDPTINASEIPNISRWLTAGQASGGPDGVKQPRAARDWARFRTFMSAAGVATPVADLYWRAAVVPARSYRAQEGYFFNQRVVQFVRDPESAAIGGSAWASMPGLWQSVLDAVDEVTGVETVRGERNG